MILIFGIGRINCIRITTELDESHNQCIMKRSSPNPSQPKKKIETILDREVALINRRMRLPYIPDKFHALVTWAFWVQADILI